MATSVRERIHEDPGLQPERTVLSWGRTLLSLCTVSAVFLRWAPTHGPYVLTLFAVALCTAAVIYSTQRWRYRKSSQGIARERVQPDAVAVFATATAVVLLGGLGLIAVVLVP